jgi:predicted Zn-dependent peptidase
VADAGVERTDLDSGIRILSERMPGVRSATLGAWVGAGSRDERPELSGATHFLEHLLFKGTQARSARDIAEAFDAVGGDVNAFTTKEFTCFYARTLDADVPMAVEILADMLRNSLLKEEDVAAERQVVLEEIAMHEDAPDDIVHDLFAETIWPDHPLGRRVQGRSETVAAMSRDDLEAYWREHYVPGNLVIAAAGSLEHEALVEWVAKAFRDAPVGPRRPPRSGEEGPAFHARLTVVERPIEQVHLAYGTAGVARNDPRRWAFGVLNAVVGGGMSSRLFQEIRERRGLVYSVYSSHSSFAETGLFSVYAATGPERVGEVLRLVRDELDRVLDGGITGEELARGKGHLRGSLVLGLEDTSGRMSRLGKGELCHGEILSPDEVVARIDAVTLEDVARVARETIGSHPWSLALVGPVGRQDFSGFVA